MMVPGNSTPVFSECSIIISLPYTTVLLILTDLIDRKTTLILPVTWSFSQVSNYQKGQRIVIRIDL
jgi:hypothetical protein